MNTQQQFGSLLLYAPMKALKAIYPICTIE